MQIGAVTHMTHVIVVQKVPVKVNQEMSVSGGNPEGMQIGAVIHVIRVTAGLKDLYD